MTEKLNEKIARWRGFSLEHYQGCTCHPQNIGHIWVRPDGRWANDEDIQFTDSMDACIKWIVPKLVGRVITINNVRDGWYCQLWAVGELEPKRIDQIAETMPLAFCLAVEKLIDSGG